MEMTCTVLAVVFCVSKHGQRRVIIHGMLQVKYTHQDVFLPASIIVLSDNPVKCDACWTQCSFAKKKGQYNETMNY